MSVNDGLEFLDEKQMFALKEPADNWEEKVVGVNRCSKVVKGGRRFSFSVFLVAGNKNGLVGYGLGKSKEVSDAVRKASESAKKHVFKISLLNQTVPHVAQGKFSGGQVILKPACSGTGIVAGGGVRAVLEIDAVKDVLSKSLGSKNKINVSIATIRALMQMRTQKQLAAMKAAEIAE